MADDEQLVWRGHAVVTLAQAAELLGLQTSSLRGYRARPGSAEPPPEPVRYASSEWGGPEERLVLLTHPDTGEALYDREEFVAWGERRRARPGMGWRRGQRGPAGRWFDDARGETSSGTAGCRSA